VEAGPSTSSKDTAIDFLGVFARWLLGGVFVYMGLQKVTHPEVFLKLVRQYDIVSSPVLLNSIAAALPWFEVLCGLLLVLGVTVRGAALNLLVMLIPFTLVILRRALAIATEQQLPFSQIKFDCGCGTGEVFIWRKLLENSGLMFLAILLLAGYGKRLCLKYALLPFSQSPVKDTTGPAKSLAAQS
jgi:uncharacterized membrane protein YphA (DoxX/SURF4 family)